MGKKNQAALNTLRIEMRQFVEEVFSGKFDDHPEVNGKPVLDNPYLISEIEKRCPGFTNEVYEKEFSVAYRNNR